VYTTSFLLAAASSAVIVRVRRNVISPMRIVLATTFDTAGTAAAAVDVELLTVVDTAVALAKSSVEHSSAIIQTTRHFESDNQPVVSLRCKQLAVSEHLLVLCVGAL
jgi:hypothetical protein